MIRLLRERPDNGLAKCDKPKPCYRQRKPVDGGCMVKILNYLWTSFMYIPIPILTLSTVGYFMKHPA